jgi:hypothetical protein
MGANTNPPWVTIHTVTLPCYEGVPSGEDQIHAPPGKVLEVCVVADRAFLSLCDYDEDHKTRTTTTTAEAQVDSMALLNALIAQMGVEKVRLVLGEVT